MSSSTRRISSTWNHHLITNRRNVHQLAERRVHRIHSNKIHITIRSSINITINWNIKWTTANLRRQSTVAVVAVVTRLQHPNWATTATTACRQRVKSIPIRRITPIPITTVSRRVRDYYYYLESIYIHRQKWSNIAGTALCRVECVAAPLASFFFHLCKSWKQFLLTWTTMNQRKRIGRRPLFL